MCKENKRPSTRSRCSKKEKVINRLRVTLLELGMEQDLIEIESGDFVKPKEVAPAWSAVVSETVLKLARADQRIVAITPAMPVGSKLENSKKNSQIV